MGQHHSPTTVSLKPQFIQSISDSAHVVVRDVSAYAKLVHLFATYPSEKSAWSRLKYVSHLFPITLPHVKHRTGMIIVCVCWLWLRRSEALVSRHGGCGVDCGLLAVCLHGWQSGLMSVSPIMRLWLMTYFKFFPCLHAHTMAKRATYSTSYHPTPNPHKHTLVTWIEHTQELLKTKTLLE